MMMFLLAMVMMILMTVLDDEMREQVASTVQVSSLFEAAVHRSLTKEL